MRDSHLKGIVKILSFPFLDSSQYCIRSKNILHQPTWSQAWNSEATMEASTGKTSRPGTCLGSVFSNLRASYTQKTSVSKKDMFLSSQYFGQIYLHWPNLYLKNPVNSSFLRHWFQIMAHSHYHFTPSFSLVHFLLSRTSSRADEIQSILLLIINKMKYWWKDIIF